MIDGSVYTAGGDALVRGYDARSGTMQYEFVGHQYCINKIAVRRIAFSSLASQLLYFLLYQTSLYGFRLWNSHSGVPV